MNNSDSHPQDIISNKLSLIEKHDCIIHYNRLINCINENPENHEFTHCEVT
jgi:hypothetical protein